MMRCAIAASLCAGSLLSAPIASADTAFDLDDLRVTTYATALYADDTLPEDAPGMDNRRRRAEEIAKHPYLLGADVLVLEELHDEPSVTVLDKGLASTFPHKTPIVGAERGGKELSGGVAIYSKFPILEQSEHLFAESCGADDTMAKGFAHAELAPTPGQVVHVIGTQVQSFDRKGCPYGGRFEEGAEIRAGQYEEIKAYADTLPEDEPVVIAGDLVADQRSEEAVYLFETLGATEPERPGYGKYTTSAMATLADKAPAARDYVLFADGHPVPDSLTNHAQGIHSKDPTVDDDDGRQAIDLSYRHAVSNWDGCGSRTAKCKRYEIKVDEVVIEDDQDPWWTLKGAGDLYGSVLVNGVPVWLHRQYDWEPVSSGGKLTLTPVESQPSLAEDGRIPVNLSVWDEDSFLVVGLQVDVIDADDEVGVGSVAWTPGDGTGQHTAEFNDGGVVVKYTVTEASELT